MKYLFLSLTLFIMSCACSKSLFGDEKLSLPKQSYKGDELRIDGYYYFKYHPVENEIYLNTYFFFENGVILYGGAVNENEIARLESDFKSKAWQDVVKKYKHRWGIYTVNGNKILFERWHPNSPAPPVVYVSEGTILNDTTFHITASYRPDGSERREKDEIYHFKQFSPKPDSTNVYIP